MKSVNYYRVSTLTVTTRVKNRTLPDQPHYPPCPLPMPVQLLDFYSDYFLESLYCLITQVCVPMHNSLNVLKIFFL
jgi:hypothetical protein